MLLLIPLLPFLGFLINLAAGRRLSKAASGGVACLAMAGAFGVSLAELPRLASALDRAAQAVLQIGGPGMAWLDSTRAAGVLDCTR